MSTSRYSVLASFILVACGGSGSTDSNPPQQPQASAPVAKKKPTPKKSTTGSTTGGTTSTTGTTSGDTTGTTTGTATGDTTGDTTGTATGDTTGTDTGTDAGGVTGDTTAGGTTTAGDPGVACPTSGAEITTLPACSTSHSATTLFAESGCVPSVDGHLHAAEWNDASCINTIHDDGSVDKVIYMKSVGGALYFASSGTPSTPSGVRFHFDPNGNAAFDDDEFTVSVFDDPTTVEGDRFDDVIRGGTLKPGPIPEGIISLCPGSNPNPIRYEWKVPFSALGVTQGSSALHTIHFAMVGDMFSSKWPAAAHATTTGNNFADQLSSWGTISFSLR